MSRLFLQQVPTIEQLCFFLPNCDCSALLCCNKRLSNFLDSSPSIAARALRNDFVRACRRGHLPAVRFLDRVDPSEKNDYVPAMMAAGNGHLHILQWMHAKDAQGFNVQTMNEAAAFGQLHVVQWLHENRTEGCTENAMDMAAGLGDLTMIRWLHENRTEGCTEQAIDRAIENGTLEILRWLHDNRTEIECSDECLVAAADGGSLDIVRWLLMSSRWCTKFNVYEAMLYAVRKGHLDVLEFLHTIRRSNESDDNCSKNCSGYLVECAIQYEQYHIAEWLHEYCARHYYVERMVVAAASYNKVQFLQSLFSEHMQQFTALKILDLANQAKTHAEWNNARDVLYWLKEKMEF